MSKLKKDERELLESVEADEWRSVPDQKAEVSRYREYAAATFKKDKRINIRLSSKDLHALQKRALREGIPYQTLVASVLHKYVSGQFSDRDA
ncbi:MAG: antitoxin [bacterium]|nr:antitoxin [bacterium]